MMAGGITPYGVTSQMENYALEIDGSPVPTPSVTPTPTVCTIVFTDVDATNPFYQFIRCLACRGLVSGYSDNTFRWYNTLTRGQLAKFVANGSDLNEPVPSTLQTFTDVPSTNPFWLFIERVYGHSIISGYTCGGPSEPCDPQNRPYYRWGADATRGQVAKIVANAGGYNDPVLTTQQTFEDVPATHPFWLYIERVAALNIISGYNCGGPGEPCLPPGNRPYYRAGNNVTRGQVSKIIASAFYPNCQTPSR
jgi:hypothetical protein